MSLTRWVTVFCDDDGCMAWDDQGGGGHTAAEARQRARGYGWVHRAGRDLCWLHRSAATMPAPGETLGEVDTERVSS